MEYHRECYDPLNWGQKVLRPKMALTSPSNGCNDLYPLEFVTDFRRVEDKSEQVWKVNDNGDIKDDSSNLKMVAARRRTINMVDGDRRKRTMKMAAAWKMKT
ncbi:hypothetical protein EMCRGX_G000739 [Ephydatia muelleri]